MERALGTAILLALVMQLVQGQGPELFPYGPSAGDMTFPTQNDYSIEVDLRSAFTFYGKKYSTIFINDNGVLSFVNKLDQYEWEKLPLLPKPGQKHILIAPFMANVDVTEAGAIYYRDTTNEGVLRDVTEKIGQYFVRNSDFKPRNALIVTWDQVGFFGSAAEVPASNTFQCVVASDAINTYVFFLYKNIAWTTDAGPGSGGNPQTGIGTKAPQAGFDAGDIKNNEILNTDNALMLPQLSNLDATVTPGFFMYHVSDSEVNSPKCGTIDPLQFYPSHASMLGGSRITVGGRCFRGSDDIVIRFGDPETDAPDLVSGNVPCEYVSRFQASCIMPRMNRIGDVTASLSLDGGSSWSDGVFTIMPIASVAPTVRRTDPWAMKWFKATRDLEITWDKSLLPGEWVNITVLSYREENETQAEGAHEWLETVLAANVPNSGRYTIKVGPNSAITHTNALGVIRIISLSKPEGVILSSDVHFLGYLLSDEGYQDDPEGWSNNYCQDWYEADQKKPSYVDDLNVCPCTLDQAQADTARFVATQYCDMTKQSAEALEKLDYCFARPEIKHCVLGVVRKSPGSDGDTGASPSQADSECCYDRDGNLVYAQDSVYGSFSNRISRFSGAVPGLSGASTDLVPYLFCIIIGNDHENYYRKARPTRDCKDYEPVRPAFVYGDPHFVTFDNASYTFNGLGEYILARTVEGAGQTKLRLEGRFQRAQDASGNPVDATVLTTLAIMENDQIKNRIQIERNDITMMTLKVGEFATVQDIGRSDYQQYPDFFVTFPENQGNGIVPKMIFLFRVSQIGLIVDSTEETLSAMILLPSQYKGRGILEGLLGNWDEDGGNDLKAKDGGSIPVTAQAQTIFRDFGQSWEIDTTGQQIFAYSGKDTHDTYQNNSFTPVFEPTGGASQRQLESVCREDKFCRFDFQVTGKSAVAAQTAADTEAIKAAMAASNKLTMCPFLTTPPHGIKTFEGSSVHHASGSTIKYECNKGYIFLGESHRTCDEKGQWSDASEPSCIEVKCGSLSPPDHGTMEVDEVDGVVTATFQCDKGVPMEGSAKRTCGEDNKWTGEETKCIKDEKQTGSDNTVIIVVVIIVVLIIIAVACGVGFYFYRKKRATGSRKVTRPPDSAYQPVETTAAGEGGDVEMGVKKEKPADEDDDGGFKEKEAEKEKEKEPENEKKKE